VIATPTCAASAFVYSMAILGISKKSENLWWFHQRESFHGNAAGAKFPASVVDTVDFERNMP